MIEEEWMTSEDPKTMLEFVRAKVSERKLRLVGCACIRLVGVWPGDESPAIAVEAAEAFADGLGSKAALRRARQAVRKTRYEMDGTDSAQQSRGICWLAEVVATENAYGAVITELQSISESCSKAFEWAKVVKLIHDIVGNPFRPAALASACQTPTVVSLGTAAYEERPSSSGELDAGRLAVLSDALEEAGCDDAAILTHLRGPGPHFRGCWALDLIIGKA